MASATSATCARPAWSASRVNVLHGSILHESLALRMPIALKVPSRVGAPILPHFASTAVAELAATSAPPRAHRRHAAHAAVRRRRTAPSGAAPDGPAPVRPAVALHCAPPALTCENMPTNQRQTWPNSVDGGVKWSTVEHDGEQWSAALATRGRRRTVFLGTHTPRLDEKGRLFLPAKFRDQLADGLVVTRGQERCLYVFPMDEFVRRGRQAAAGAGDQQGRPRLPAGVPLRRLRRAARQAGPDHHPAGLRDYAGLARDCAVIGAGSRVEIWDTAAWAAYLGPPSRPSPSRPRRWSRVSSDPMDHPARRPAPAARSPPAPRPGAPSPVPGRTRRAVGDLTAGTTARPHAPPQPARRSREPHAQSRRRTRHR